MWSSVVTFASFLPLLFTSALSAPAVQVVGLEQRAILSSLYDDLVFYYKYATSTSVPCPKPNGKTFVAKINDVLTDTQGIIARDDLRKEIVISFRGSTSLQDFLIDVNILLIPMVSPGVDSPYGVRVHAGFLFAWNSVAKFVISTVKEQLSKHPDYSIVTTGHSLGGALSSIASISMKQNFPTAPVRMYTYGQPRTGDASYAAWLNQEIGSGNEFRVVHTTDPIPHLPPQEIGYSHHGVEYWIRKDPANANNTKRCKVSGEDSTCSNSVPLNLNPASSAHKKYFDIDSLTSFCS